MFRLQYYSILQILPQNINLGGNDYVRLSIMAKLLVFQARFPGAPPLQRVALLGFSPSTIVSGPNRQSYQRSTVALFVRTASSVRGAIFSRIPIDRASLLWIPSLYHIEPCEVLLTSTLSRKTHMLQCLLRFEIHQTLQHSHPNVYLVEPPAAGLS